MAFGSDNQAQVETASRVGQHAVWPGATAWLVRRYVPALRAARRMACRTGALAWLDRHREQPAALLCRSLFAVHDIADMTRLDLAWWTFPALARIDAFLRARDGAATAFEYGPGASTIWLARRCRTVDFVEHDSEWWPALQPSLTGLGNVTGKLVAPLRPEAGLAPAHASGRSGWEHLDFAEYVAAIRDADRPFDLIVIDGRARAACLMEAVRHLKDDGMIVFDDAGRRRYRGALDACGLAIRRYRGFAPTSPYPSETALLARQAAVLAALP